MSCKQIIETIKFKIILFVETFMRIFLDNPYIRNTKVNFNILNLQCIYNIYPFYKLGVVKPFFHPLLGHPLSAIVMSD